VQYPTETVVAHIEDIVRTAQRGVLGTDLMSSVRIKFDGFLPAEYGALNLRDFIQRFVRGVVPIDRRGMDYLYGVPQSAGDAVAAPARESPLAADQSSDSSIWKTFASPSTVYRLYANKETGKLIAHAPGASPPDSSWVQIPSMTREKHIAVAKEFINTLGDEGQKERLARSFDQPQWWVSFYESIKAEGLAAPWNAIRRKRVIEELTAALESAGVPPKDAASQIALEQRSAPRIAPRPIRSVVAMPSVRSSPRLKTVAERIVQNMSLAELRSLRVRLGDVFDALDG
jgi:hypothetical protein